MSSAALELEGISKRFGAVQALDAATLSVRRGEVHGLVGANGSGKSTLVKILAGYHQPDAGTVRTSHGLAVIHQDLGLVDELTVTENVVATTGFGARGGRPISWRAQHRRVTRLLAELGIAVDGRAPVGAIGRGGRTLVAVARAICELEAHDGAQLLITDEPTSALSTAEAGALWDLLRRVCARGGAVLFISHHLQEVRTMCDRVTVLRDGRVVLTGDCPATTEDELVEAMLGAAPEVLTAARERGEGAGLAVRELGGEGLEDVSFDIAPGEVVGVTGLLGAGQEALPGLLAGVAPRRGSVRVWEAELPAGDLQAALDAGVALVPADRRRDGLWAEGSVAENLGIGAPGRWNRARERRSAPELIARFGVRPADPSLPIRALSGGNQQKVLLAKWLQRDPRVVLLHEPTQGVDVAAKREIHRIVREFATRTGAAVCLVSSDHEETADACDRVLVMAGGRITGELAGAELSPNRILATANAA